MTRHMNVLVVAAVVCALLLLLPYSTAGNVLNNNGDHGPVVTFVTDANATKVTTASNRTIDAYDWDLITLFLFVSHNPNAVDASPNAVASSVDAHAKLSALATAVRLYDASGRVAERVQLFWGLCGVHPHDDKSSCGIAQQYGLDISTLPQLIVLGSDGNRVEAWERVQLLRQPSLHAAAHVASHVRPVVRRVYSVSDLTALPAALVDEHEASGYSLRPRILVLSSSAPRTESQDASVRTLLSKLRGIATVYAINGPQPFKELHDTKGSATCSPESVDGELLTVIRLDEASKTNVEHIATEECLSTPLLRAAAQRAAVRGKGRSLRIETRPLPRHLLSDAHSSADQTGHATEVTLLNEAAHLLFGDVELTSPLNRDFVLSRAPTCSLIHFIPNLFNASATSSAAAGTTAPQSLVGASNSHVNYYAVRHRKLIKSLAAAAGTTKCAVTLLDPQGNDKDLFLSVGFKHGDVFQTSATIRDTRGKSFSGKSRDNLIVLTLNNTFRYKYSGAYYDAADVEAFVRKEISLVASRGGRVSLESSFSKTLVMRSAFAQLGSGASLSPTVCGNAAMFPWHFVPSVGTDAALGLRRKWEVEAPKWLATATYDTFDKQVLGDVTRDTVLLVIPTVSNATVRGNTTSPSLRLEAAVGQLVTWVARRHPSTHGALRFARFALDENDLPRVLLPHVPAAPLPLSPPYLFYIPRNSKVDLMSDGRPKNSGPVAPSHRPQNLEALKLTSAERKAAQLVRIPSSLSKAALPLSAVRDELREALQIVSPLQWVFDTRYMEGSDGVKEEEGGPIFDESQGSVMPVVTEDGAWEGEENEF